MKPGQGWVAAEVRDSNSEPAALVAEGGVKVTQDWAAFGDAWWRPSVGEYGGDVAARYKGNIDIYAGAQANTQGDWQASAGVKWRF